MSTALTRALIHSGPLAVRLTQGRAVDLSDGEIARCMGQCVAPDRCIALARVLRDAGEFLRHGDEWRVRSGDYGADSVDTIQLNLEIAA